MLADMAIGIEAARLMTWRSAWEMDLGKRNSYYASIAKALASEVANKAAADAVQVNSFENLYDILLPMFLYLNRSSVARVTAGISLLRS